MTALIVYFSLLGANISLGDMDDVVLLYRDGTWMEQIQYRLANFLLLRAEAIFVIPMNVFLFLTGVRLMRSGAFSPDKKGKEFATKCSQSGYGSVFR